MAQWYGNDVVSTKAQTQQRELRKKYCWVVVLLLYSVIWAAEIPYCRVKWEGCD